MVFSRSTEIIGNQVTQQEVASKQEALLDPIYTQIVQMANESSREGRLVTFREITSNIKVDKALKNRKFILKVIRTFNNTRRDLLVESDGVRYSGHGLTKREEMRTAEHNNFMSGKEGRQKKKSRPGEDTYQTLVKEQNGGILTTEEAQRIASLVPIHFNTVYTNNIFVPLGDIRSGTEIDVKVFLSKIKRKIYEIGNYPKGEPTSGKSHSLVDAALVREYKKLYRSTKSFVINGERRAVKKITQDYILFKEEITTEPNQITSSTELRKKKEKPLTEESLSQFISGHQFNSIQIGNGFVSIAQLESEIRNQLQFSDFDLSNISELLSKIKISIITIGNDQYRLGRKKGNGKYFEIFQY